MTQLPWYLGLVVAGLAALLGRAYGQRLHARGITLSNQLNIRDVPLLPLALLAFVGTIVLYNLTMNNPHWSWYIPVALEYISQPAMWAMELFFVLFSMIAITTLAWHTRKPLGIGLLLFALFVGATVEGLLRHHSAPRLGDMHHRVSDGMIRQTTGSTCAAASCANIATYYGIEKTEADMAALLGTTWNGTSPSQMVYGLRSLGIDARKVTIAPDQIASIQVPAVLLIQFGDKPDGHAVAYMGMDDGLAEIWDPQGGIQFKAPQELAEQWLGHAIENQRSPSLECYGLPDHTIQTVALLLKAQGLLHRGFTIHPNPIRTPQYKGGGIKNIVK